MTTTDVGGGVQGLQPYYHTLELGKIRAKSHKNRWKVRNLGCTPSQHCCMCVYFTKMAPKWRRFIFIFWRSCFNLACVV